MSTLGSRFSTLSFNAASAPSAMWFVSGINSAESSIKTSAVTDLEHTFLKALLRRWPMGDSYRDLIAWQKAMVLVTEIYKVTGNFPREEQYGLTNKLRRAAVSVPSNIAEGQACFSPKKFRQFLSHARGSLVEIETQISIAVNLALLA
ncbi:MAG TPA: four helix bundle protein [Candidatus Binatia bacterium]|nr:four helix bundle protein [Candidatus Binatia bacterium]